MNRNEAQKARRKWKKDNPSHTGWYRCYICFNRPPQERITGGYVHETGMDLDHVYERSTTADDEANKHQMPTHPVCNRIKKRSGETPPEGFEII